VGQIAIVTGGASGIGLALGAALVQRGWHVVLADVQATTAGVEAERLTRTGPGSAVAAGVDVRDADAVASLVQRTHAEHGRLDLMVNNAGIGLGGEPDELQLVHWNTLIDINLRGVIHGCHVAYPLMKQQRFGTILNTASAAGLFPLSGLMTPYATTKYGVVGLSLGLRAAGAEYGVRVSVLCPGWIDAALLDGVWPAELPRLPSRGAQPSLRQVLLNAGQPIYPADKCAEDTLAGLAKNKPILVVPSLWRRTWLLTRLFPNAAIKQAEKATTRSRHPATTSQE